MTVYVFWAAVVTSATALIIAFVAYPWQRKRDHEAELLLERMRLFKDYIAAANELYYSTLFKNEAAHAAKVTEFVSKAHQAYLMSGPEIGAKIDEHVGKVSEYSNFFRGKGNTFDPKSEEFVALKNAEGAAYDSLFEDMLSDIRAPESAIIPKRRPDLTDQAA